MKLYMWKKFSRKLHRLRRFSQSRLRQRFSRRLHRPRKFRQKNLRMSSRPGNLLKKPLLLMDSQIALQKLIQLSLPMEPVKLEMQ